jgi:hypothetical protein
MNKLIFSLLVLVAALCSNVPAQEEPPGWITLAPEGAGFSVLLPGKATESVTKKTSFTLHSFNVTVGRATYMASYSDYVPGKLDPATALTANRDKFNKSLQATLVSSREITVDGHTGIEFTSETPAANVKSQLFLIGDRMYQTVAFVFRDVDETRNVNRFFDSFRLMIKPGAGAEDRSRLSFSAPDVCLLLT